VVDVRATARHTPVVEDDDLWATGGEVRGNRLLADGAVLPRLLVLWRVLKSQEQAADVRMGRTRLCLTPLTASFQLAPCAGASRTQIEIVRVPRHLTAIGTPVRTLKARCGSRQSFLASPTTHAPRSRDAGGG